MGVVDVAVGVVGVFVMLVFIMIRILVVEIFVVIAEVEDVLAVRLRLRLGLRVLTKGYPNTSHT